MSIPKEPRQKMINMMYLVLTALLALNVSVEVLNAFKTVNTSLENSNNVVSQKNNLTYTAFQKNLEDPSTKALAEIWSKPAFQVQSYAAAFSTYLEALKTQLQKESGLKTQDGKAIYNEGDLDAATRMFDQGGHGKKLYDSLDNFKKYLLSELDPNNPAYANANLSDLTKQEMITTRAEFAKRLPIDLRI